MGSEPNWYQRRIGAGRARWIGAVVAVAAWLAAGAGAVAGPPATRPAGDFAVFQWTPYSERLLAPGTGIRPVYLIEDGFWARGADGGWDRIRPDEKATRATAWMLARKGVPVVIDIEHWPVDVRRAGEAQVRESLGKLAQIIDWIHAERPGVRVGFYGLLPLRDYWTPVSDERARREGQADGAARGEYERWVKANALVAEYLGGRVDFVFPSLYTFYADPAGWAVYAKANLVEARKVGKPVYPFLWMEYHDSNAELRGRELPRGVWREELELCRREADGVVIWGAGRTGPDGRYVVPPWNEGWGWWRETMAFMRELRAGGG